MSDEQIDYLISTFKNYNVEIYIKDNGSLHRIIRFELNHKDYPEEDYGEPVAWTNGGCCHALHLVETSDIKVFPDIMKWPD